MKIILRLSLLIVLMFNFNVIASYSYSNSNSNSNSNFDVYGTSEKTANQIIKTFDQEVQNYAKCSIPENKMTPLCQPAQRECTKKKIIEKIRKKYDFTYVNISTILYHDGQVFSTIDVIEQKDSRRIAYLNHFDKIKFNPHIRGSQSLENLITYWNTYMDIGENLFFKKELYTVKACPVYHCTFGFEHVALKKYQAIFDVEVTKHKYKLIEILKTDPDEKRRATAACLLAHIKEGEELIDILVCSLQDPSKTVRNNVMRVLGATLEVLKPVCFNIDPIIQALDSPILTDRNKALYMLISLSSQPKHARYIAKHARVFLINSLKMKQPNLHNNAYGVLKNISDQSYDEHDYVSWNRWLLEQL